ncbi:MAG: EAL domain-containing protein [Rubrivivax sp.]|nr:EAL domain-containing protein [Rubrivivax sp.]
MLPHDPPSSATPPPARPTAAARARRGARAAQGRAEPAGGPVRRGTVARGIFGLVLAATLLPLVLFVCGGYVLMVQEAQRRLEVRTLEENRHVAGMIQDRLDTAHAFLAAMAQGWPANEEDLPPGGPMLGAWARVSAQGRLSAGDLATLAAWQAGAGADPSRAESTARTLAIPGVPAQVLVRHRLADGSQWLARVEPGYLWASHEDQGTEFRHCVSDGQSRELHCTAPTVDADIAAIAATFTARSPVKAPAAGTAAPWTVSSHARHPQRLVLDSPVIWRWTMLGALGTLLLAGGLGWWQFRRTAASLDALIDGTQRLAAQDWQARVVLPRTDEFGQLAHSLNHMAERIGQQMQAMRVQSAIDREILGGLDTARIMSLVAQRLQALLPQARVAVVVLGDGRGPWRAHVPHGDPVPVAAQAQTPLPPQGLIAFHPPGIEGVPAWAQQALQADARSLSALCWVPAVWQGQMLALLVIGGREPGELGEEARREIAELRDRTAVTLAAAAREAALLERAVLDGLTGLLNRNGLHDAIDRLLASQANFTLMLVDLDRFKEVNDTMGHQAGDELLCAVAGRLRRCVHEQAVIARPGGDEFVLLLPGAEEDATAAAMAVCAELAKPFSLRGARQQIGGSVGLAACPAHGNSRVELMRRADMAMYAAKAEGRGRLSWYQPALDARLAHRSWMAQELRRALDQTQLHLHYQPRVSAVTGEVVCAEALVRWQHAERGAIMPTEFVAAAEETGLIDRLGQWVLTAAVVQMAQWRAEGLPLPRVAVNVSPRQLKAPGFADLVLDTLARHQLSGKDIEIELTENLFSGDLNSITQALQPLREAGVLIALDDFGTGYSSLSSLYRLPVDVIKIDRSFVSDLGRRASADAVARSIVALAKALRKRVVAEGVETRAQRDHLLRLDCDELQGYLYARPMAARELERRLRGGAAVEAGLADAGPAAGSAPTRAAEQRAEHAAHDLPAHR